MSNTEVRNIIMLYEKAKRAEIYAQKIKDIHTILMCVLDRETRLMPKNVMPNQTFEQYVENAAKHIKNGLEIDDLKKLFKATGAALNETREPVSSEFYKIFEV